MKTPGVGSYMIERSFDNKDKFGKDEKKYMLVKDERYIYNLRNNEFDGNIYLASAVPGSGQYNPRKDIPKKIVENL